MDIINFEKVRLGETFKLIDCRFKENKIIHELVLIRIKKDAPSYPDAYIIRSVHERDKLGKGQPFYLKEYDKVILFEL